MPDDINFDNALRSIAETVGGLVATSQSSGEQIREIAQAIRQPAPGVMGGSHNAIPGAGGAAAEFFMAALAMQREQHRQLAAPAPQVTAPPPELPKLRPITAEELQAPARQLRVAEPIAAPSPAASGIAQAMTAAPAAAQTIQQPAVPLRSYPPTFEQIQTAALSAIEAGQDPIAAMRETKAIVGEAVAAGAAAPPPTIPRAGAPIGGGAGFTPSGLAGLVSGAGGVAAGPGWPSLGTAIATAGAATVMHALNKMDYPGSPGVGGALAMWNRSLVQGMEMQTDIYSFHNSASGRFLHGLLHSDSQDSDLNWRNSLSTRFLHWLFVGSGGKQVGS
jgi:hypothetical protein